MLIIEDTEGLPSGFTQRCELLKGSTCSQCPFVPLGSSPTMDKAAWELLMPCRRWNLVMEMGSEHRTTCSPFRQAGTRSQLGHTPWPCKLPAAAAVRISPGSSCSPKHMCLMCPQGRLAPSCQSTVQGAVRGKPDSCFHSLAFAFPPAKQLSKACEGLAHTLSINMDSLW